MKFTISNKLYIEGLKGNIIDAFKQALTIQNPAFMEAERHKRWTGNIPSVLRFYEKIPGGISVPRGFTREALDICDRHQLAPEIVDQRRTLPELDIRFRGTLRPYQESASRDICSRQYGVLQSGTGSGKTVIGLHALAQRRQPTLILVHTKELLKQWQDRIETFLDVTPGQVGDGKFDVKPLTVGMVQTVRKHLDKLSECFGQLIVDECHRTPSSAFSECVSAFDCKYLMGLTATPYRSDGLDKLIAWNLGDIIHEVDTGMLQKNGAILKPQIVTRQTSFTYPYADDYTLMLSALIRTYERNLLIVRDIAKNTNESGVSLVVSDRIEHLQTLMDMTQLAGKALLTGSTPTREREQIVQDLAAGRVKVLFSTLSLIGEGFDCPGLCNLHLAMPVKFKGRLLQIVGRIIRPQRGKSPKVFDYVDARQPVLAAQAISRKKVFEEIGWM